MVFLLLSLFNSRHQFHVVHPHLIIQLEGSFSSHLICLFSFWISKLNVAKCRCLSYRLRNCATCFNCFNHGISILYLWFMSAHFSELFKDIVFQTLMKHCIPHLTAYLSCLVCLVSNIFMTAPQIKKS